MPKILSKPHIPPLIFILLLITVFLFIFSLTYPEKVILSNQSKWNRTVGEIYGDEKIGQTFLAKHNNLSAIEVRLATYNRENKGEFIFHLKSKIDSIEDIYNFIGDMSIVEDNAFFDFSFPKIENSKGKKYFFHIESPNAQPGNAITIWANSNDLYKDGEKIINGVPSQGDLVFKTKYELGIRLSFKTFLGNMVSFGSFLINIFRNKVFYFLLFVLVFVWALIYVTKKVGIFNKKGGYILVFCILFVIVSLWIIILFSKKIVVYNQKRNNSTEGEIFGDKKIGQTFIADYNNLSAIDVLLATYNRENFGEFIFHLRKDVSSKEDLFHYKGEISKVKDNSYLRFHFHEIESSKGEKFYFYIEAPDSQPGNAITIWSNTKDLYWEYREGERIVNGASSEGDLTFKTVYDVGLKNKFTIFLEEITRNKPSPLNKKSFYITLIILFVLSSSLFMAFLFKYFVER